MLPRVCLRVQHVNVAVIQYGIHAQLPNISEIEIAFVGELRYWTKYCTHINLFFFKRRGQQDYSARADHLYKKRKVVGWKTTARTEQISNNVFILFARSLMFYIFEEA